MSSSSSSSSSPPPTVPPPSAAAAAAAAALSAPVTYLTLLRAAPCHHQLFVATVVAQCVCVLLERAWLFASSDLSPEGVRQACYFLLVIALSALFVVYFAVHSVLQANAFETAAFFVASLLLLVRLAVEYFNRSDECASNNGQTVCAVFLAASIIFVVAAMCFTSFIFRDLQWKRYKAIGAEVSTRRMYMLYELFSAVRKLDLQFSLITLVTGLVFLDVRSNEAAIGAIVANVLLFVVELAWERLGDLGIKGESPHHLWAFWALSPLLPCFILGIAVDTLTSSVPVLKLSAYTGSLRATIAVMGVLAVLNRGATVLCTALLYANFGPNYVGLRRVIMGDRKGRFHSRRASFAHEDASSSAAAASAAAVGGASSVVVVANVAATAAAAAAAAAAASGGDILSGPGRPAPLSSSAAAAAVAAARADRVAQLAGARTVSGGAAAAAAAPAPVAAAAPPPAT